MIEFAESRIDLAELFERIDAMDADGFVEFLTPEATFRFGSAPPAVGRNAIREAVAGFFSSIAGLSHSLSMALGENDTLVCEGEATYTRHDGSEITLPFANVFELDSGLIAEYKIYADITPLYNK